MVQVRIGRIGRPHGVRGEVTVKVHTDDPAARFAAGAELLTDPPERGPLTVVGARRSGPVMVVAFVDVGDRTAAESLRGTTLLLDEAELPPPTEEDEYYDHQLVGLTVRNRAGTVLGAVADVLHPPASPVLVVDRPDGSQELVPFVAVIVPEIDLAAGFAVVDPPDGMFV